tara:strand:+ start:754 stop:1062 length:309 start_codon:yes stop_codon:yes gene_type:complete
MTTTLRLAQVAGGAGGPGTLVDAVTSVTISDTRIRAYTYATSTVQTIRIVETAAKGLLIEQPVLTANTGSSIYIGDDGVRAHKGTRIMVSAAAAAKVYVYYG